MRQTFYGKNIVILFPTNDKERCIRNMLSSKGIDFLHIKEDESVIISRADYDLIPLEDKRHFGIEQPSSR